MNSMVQYVKSITLRNGEVVVRSFAHALVVETLHHDGLWETHHDCACEAEESGLSHLVEVTGHISNPDLAVET
jgi:hypothetical protein